MVSKSFNEYSWDDRPPLPPTLTERVAQAHAFFDPQNLANLLIKYEGEIGLLVIDVQQRYCDPQNYHRLGSAETVAVSERIQSLAPEFRRAGISIYAVYADGDPAKDASEVDFYNFSPEPEDTLVFKDQQSAFKGGNIKEILDRDNKKLLLVCGIYLAQCVAKTAHDAARKGFDVCVLDDMTGEFKQEAHNREHHLDDMRLDGIAVMQSGVVLEALKIAQKAKAKTPAP